MSHYDDLDLDIIATGRPFTERPLSTFDVAIFPTVLRKMAAGEPRPDEDLVKHIQDTQTGEAATPAEAAAHTAVGQPDDTGHLEGEFAVPVEQVVMTLAQIVSNSMRQHGAYAYYAEMMRGLGRGGLIELFEEQGEDELQEMHYFLRRMSVLQPGGVPIPPHPTPQPSDDPMVALNFLIAGEQQAIVLFKALHAQLGDNPMKYTLEQIQSDAQEHMDKLWQFMPQGVPEKQAAQKIAVSMEWIKSKTRSGALKHLATQEARAAKLPMKEGNLLRTRVSRAAHEALRGTRTRPSMDELEEAGRGLAADKRQVFREAAMRAIDEFNKRSAAEQPVAVPAPGAEPIEHYLLRDQQLRLQQSEAEKQEMGAQLQQMQQMVVQQQMAAEQAQAATQQATMDAEQSAQTAAASQQQAVAAQQQTASATEMANQSQQMAAAQAEAKMRLSMRIQQLRQQLADIVSADPVSEELGGGQAAGAGAPATPGQQQQQQAQQAQVDQMIQEQQQAASVGGTRAKKEVEQAQKAEQNAQNQRQQAMLVEQGA